MLATYGHVPIPPNNTHALLIQLAKWAQKKRRGTMCVRIKQPSRPVTKNGALLFFEETLQKERKEIREYIELSIPANVFITQFDTVFHIGVRFPFDEIIE